MLNYRLYLTQTIILLIEILGTSPVLESNVQKHSARTHAPISIPLELLNMLKNLNEVRTFHLLLTEYFFCKKMCILLLKHHDIDPIFFRYRDQALIFHDAENLVSENGRCYKL